MFGRAPPATSAQISEDDAEAANHDNIAAEAGTKEAEAQSDQEARSDDQSQLLKIDAAIAARGADADATDAGLDARQAKQEQLQDSRQDTDAQVDEAAGNVSDLTTFARYVARLLGVAGWFDSSLMPGSIQEAGREIAESGAKVHETTSGTILGIEDQRAGRGAEQSTDTANQGRHRQVESAAGRHEGSAPRAAASKSAEMTEGNQELQSIAAEQASIAAGVRAEASAEADRRRQRRDQNTSALENWAEESQSARHQWITETSADLDAQGYDVVGVSGQ